MCMGPPPTLPDLILTGGVYPHVYGATHVLLFTTDQTMGLSPCVWGHRLPQATIRCHCGSIPMCMGPPTYIELADYTVWVYPHVYGATMLPVLRSFSLLRLSPCV